MPEYHHADSMSKKELANKLANILYNKTVHGTAPVSVSHSFLLLKISIVSIFPVFREYSQILIVALLDYLTVQHTTSSFH